MPANIRSPLSGKAFLSFFLMAASLLLISHPTYATTKVRQASPTAVELSPGKSVIVNIKGIGLNKIKTAGLYKDKSGRQFVKGLNGVFSGNAKSGKLTLKLSGNVAAGQYYLRLHDAKRAIAVLPVRAVIKPASAGSTARKTVAILPKITRTKTGLVQNTKKPASKLRSATEARLNSTIIRGQVATSGQPVNDPLSPRTAEAKRITLTSFSINNRATETKTRVVTLRLETRNGPARAYRICEGEASAQAPACDISRASWRTLSSNSFSYTFTTPTIIPGAVSMYDLAARMYDKRLTIQVKGDTIPSPTIRNINIDNFSTTLHAQITLNPTAVLLSFPPAVQQYTFALFKFSVKGIEADHIRTKLYDFSNRCSFGDDRRPATALMDKTGANQFDIRHWDYANVRPGYGQVDSCRVVLLITSFDATGNELDKFRFVYDQGFLPYTIKKITVEDTYQLRDYLNIMEDTMFLADQGYAICAGNSVGVSGIKKLGVVNEGGDLVIKTRSSPVGRTCSYSLNASVRGGWLLTMNFTETRQGNDCVVSKSGRPKHIAPMIMSFSRGRKFVGWETAVNAFSGSRGPYNGEADRPVVFLTCSPTISNNSGVKSILTSVEFEVPPDAPDNATWRDAFRR